MQYSKYFTLLTPKYRELYARMKVYYDSAKAVISRVTVVNSDGVELMQLSGNISEDSIVNSSLFWGMHKNCDMINTFECLESAGFIRKTGTRRGFGELYEVTLQVNYLQRMVRDKG